MSSLEHPPMVESSHERMERDPYAVVTMAYKEVATVERDPWLRTKIGKLGKQLRIAATLCMLGLACGSNLGEQAERSWAAGVTAAEQGGGSAAELMPAAIPSPETIVETLFTGEPQTVSVNGGTWEISIDAEGEHTEAVERWRTIGKRVRDAMLRNAPKLSEKQIAAIEDMNQGGGEPTILMPAIAAGGAELDKIAEEFDDEGDALLQFAGETEMVLWNSLTPAEHAAAVNKVVAQAQALGITMTWIPFEP